MRLMIGGTGSGSLQTTVPRLCAASRTTWLRRVARERLLGQHRLTGLDGGRFHGA